MKPEVDTVLNNIFGSLALEIAPLLAETGYAASNVGLNGLMLTFAAQEFDRAADIRVQDNKELRALFARAADVITDAALAAKLKDAAATQDADAKVSTVTASNNQLRALLIELHEQTDGHIHADASDAIRALDDEIWAFLTRSTERRKLSGDILHMIGQMG